MTVSDAWERLIELGISEQALRIVTNINGYNLDTLEDVLYSEYGYRNFEQFNDESEQ
jgi:hypothetical protein